MDKKVDKKIQPLNLSKKVVELLKQKADEDERSMSWVANKILEKELHA